MSGEIKDISLGGAFICCRESLKPKEVFEMHFTDPSLGSRIKVTAEVVWSNIYDSDDESQSRGMGVRFATISDENRKVLSTLISNHPKLA
jgi:c-di-GMP-binding flagellar brake protein YcgR